MGPEQRVDQHAMDMVTSQPGIAPAMGAIEKIGPLVEYLLQMLGQQQQPQKAFKSSEMGRPQPQQNPGLRGQMMGQPQGFADPAAMGQPRIPGVMY